MNRSQSVVSKCELGLRRIDIVEVRQYCRAIGVKFPRFAEIYEANIVAGTVVRKKRTY
ncbi:hypothetical protein [Edaphobacter flagellatus]|uniref:hypothetical protein n=1 Tax=Edaphobacter flagellatus TaxID=1933044 RepID=UPI0036F39BA1